MQIYARDFVEHRPKASGSGEDYYVDGKPIALGKSDPKDYVIRKLKQSPAIDLTHGPALIVCMGVFQAEDSAPKPIEEVRNNLQSGKMPYLKMFLDKLAPGANLEPVLKHISEGLPRMCRGYFRMTDEVLYQPTLQMNPFSTYVVSYDSMEERSKIMMHDILHADQNRYTTREAVDFVDRVIAPYLGEQHRLVEEDGKRFIEVGGPKPVEDIVRCTENIVLLGNSTGTSFVVEVENALMDTLKRSNFSKDDTRRIMGSIRALGLGNLADYESLKGPRFTSVYFEGINDLVSQAVNPRKIKVSEEDIRKYCPPEQQEMLARAARAHLEQLEHAFDNPLDQADAGRMALTDKQIFMPRLQADKNRALVLASVPTDRQYWATRDLLRPARRVTARQAGDAATEQAFNGMLEQIGQDKNGHHIAFLLTQGYPPFYLPELVQNMLLNMMMFPSLPEQEKRQFEAADFMTRRLARHNISHDARSVMQKDMLMEPVRMGLECAKKPAQPASPAR